MNEKTFVRTAWIAIGAVTILRFAFAASLPMTGDEAYYWEWSRRLALGYIDHPPMVAYAIALFAWLGHAPFVVRLPFVLCGIGTTVCIADAARTVWRSERAAAVAGLAATLAPMLIVLFVTVTPEGPASFAWALALCAGLRAYASGSRVWFAVLGAALGLALLSHFLCWGLVLGFFIYAMLPANRPLWNRAWMALAVAAVFYAPFVVWNAQNDWVTFAFALVHRHPSEVQVVRPLTTYLLCAAAFSPGLWIAATIAARRPRHALIVCTALPLALALLIVALHERVEAYWFTGPFLSLCVALPGAVRSRASSWWALAPAGFLSALLFAAGIAPFQLYGAAQHLGLHLRNSGPFEIFSYGELAHRAAVAASARRAVIMTDGYGFSSLIDYYAGAQPVFIGYDAQGQEARRWFGDAQDPNVALFVDKAPLDSRPDFQRQLGRACGAVTAGPTFTTKYRTYYSTWCSHMHSDAMAVLRWRQ